MEKVKISGQAERFPGQTGRWTVEYAASEWDPPIVNVYDTFEQAVARAKAIGPLISCGINDTREGVVSCLAKNILDPLPPLKFGEGRGDTVSISLPSGGHRLVSKRTARRLGMKTSRSKPKTS